MNILHKKHSKNYDLRPDNIKKPKYVIIHYTEMNFDDAVSRLCDPSAKVSAHYVIKKTGEIYQLVGDFYRAWHCGVSEWKGEKSINNNSIGIELDNLGNEEFSDELMNSLLELLKLLRNKYDIFPENIIGHSDIAPSRKIDPGIFFNWKILRKNGFGIRIFQKESRETTKMILSPTQLTNLQIKFKQIGYGISCTGELDKQTSDVIRAFQSHFNQTAIHNQGGHNFLKNLENIYEWDEQSDIILNNIAGL